MISATLHGDMATEPAMSRTARVEDSSDQFYTISPLSGIAKLVPLRMDQLYSLYGTEYSQVLELCLQPGMVLSTQPGMLLHYDPELTLTIDTGGMGQAASRALAGESIVRLNVANNTAQSHNCAVASKVPGSIIPVDLTRGSFVFKRRAFIAAIGFDWRVNIMFAPSVQTACFGGQGVLLNELAGGSMAFLTGCGSLMEKYLEPGETLYVDSRCVLGFDRTVTFDVSCMGDSCMTWCFGGHGVFNTALTGPGRVIIQSYPIEKLLQFMPVPNEGNGGGGGGDGGSGGGGGGGD